MRSASVSEPSGRPGAFKNRSPLTFFALVFGLSVPFWLMGAATDLPWLPGLPVSALMAVCPAAAALLLVYREHRAAGVIELLSRSLDHQRILAKRWYLPIFLLMPGVSLAVYALMRCMGLPMPTPQMSIAAALLMFGTFFVGALGEELGWSGYVLDPLQTRWSALRAGVTLGIVGILWHLVPLLMMHRTPAWIAWWCLYAVASRVLIVWLYNNTGKSVCGVALFHATLNLSFMLFPIHGSHFDMRLGGLVMAFAATVVTVIWGPETLARQTRA